MDFLDRDERKVLRNEGNVQIKMLGRTDSYFSIKTKRFIRA